MNQTALEITRGNYLARTGVDRKDELGQLVNSLDHLALELGSTINQLFQEKGKLKDIISSISEGIIAFDTILEPVSFNAALSKIMNRPHPYSIEALKKDLEDLGIWTQVSKAIEERKPLQVHKDWQGKKLVFTFSLIVDNHATITGIVALPRKDAFRNTWVRTFSGRFIRAFSASIR